MKREHKKDEKKNITEDVKRRHLFTIFYLLDVFCAAVANKIKAGIKLHKSVIFDIGFRNPPPNITLNEHQFRGFFGTIPAFCLSIISHRQYATIHTYSSSDPDIAAGNNAKRKCCRFSGHTAIPSIAVCYRYSSLISGINTARPDKNSTRPHEKQQCSSSSTASVPKTLSTRSQVSGMCCSSLCMGS